MRAGQRGRLRQLPIAGYRQPAQIHQQRAAIGVDRKGYYLGLFESVEGARSAYLAAKAVLHPFRTTREVSA